MIKNILSNWSSLIISTIAVFILYPYCVQVLGEEQYGVWLLISSITGYFSLLQLGVPMANVRFISQYYACNEMEKVNEVVSTNFAFFAMMGLLTFIVGSGLSFVIDVIFKVPPELKSMARVATIVASLNIGLSFAFEVFEGLLNALQQFVFFNLVKNVIVIVRVCITFFVLQYDNGLVALAWILTLATVIQAGLFYTYIRIRYPVICISSNKISISVLKKVSGYSIFILIFLFASKISFNTDAMVISRVISVSAIVLFTVANNFLIYLSQFIVGISDALMPKISGLSAIGNQTNLKDIYLHLSKLVCFLLLPICLTFFFFGGDFIALWMGEKYRLVSGNILSILTLSYLFFLVQRGVAFPIMMGTSHVRFPTILMLMTALMNLLLSIWWGKVYGIYGVAWGTTVPNLVSTAGIIWYMLRTFNVHCHTYLYRGILIPLSSGVFFAVPGLISHKYILVDSYLKFTMVVSVSIVVYFCFLHLLYLEQREKNLLAHFLAPLRIKC